MSAELCVCRRVGWQGESNCACQLCMWRLAVCTGQKDPEVAWPFMGLACSAEVASRGHGWAQLSGDEKSPVRKAGKEGGVTGGGGGWLESRRSNSAGGIKRACWVWGLSRRACMGKLFAGTVGGYHEIGRGRERKGLAMAAGKDGGRLSHGSFERSGWHTEHGWGRDKQHGPCSTQV